MALLSSFVKKSSWLLRLLLALLLWQSLVWGLEVPPYLLPPPYQVMLTLVGKAPELAFHALVTGSEMLVGLLLALVLAIIMASAMFLSPRLANLTLPYIVVAQSLPVFALAPLLTLWLGFSLASKITMAVLIMIFPLFSALYDGLCHPRQDYLWLGQSFALSRWQDLTLIRFPAALPHLASGLKIAAVAAPIGAVVGEWVGAEAGLGYYMLHANGLMRTDGLFAALVILMGLSLLLFSLTQIFAKILLRWHGETKIG